MTYEKELESRIEALDKIIQEQAKHITFLENEPVYLLFIQIEFPTFREVIHNTCVFVSRELAFEYIHSTIDYYEGREDVKILFNLELHDVCVDLETLFKSMQILSIGMGADGVFFLLDNSDTSDFAEMYGYEL